MAINNKRFMELRAAAMGGDQEAATILRDFLRDNKGPDIAKRVDEYFGTEGASPLSAKDEHTQADDIPTEEFMSIQATAKPEYAGDDELEKAIQGFVGESDIPGKSFSDFLREKKDRMDLEKRGPDFFAAFAPDRKAAFMTFKSDGYKKKLGKNRRDADRSHRDLSRSINAFISEIGNQSDDGIPMDMTAVSDAYGNIVSNEDGMASLGRARDDDDAAEMLETLKNLCVQYGKANVIAALNTIGSDIEAYHADRTKAIDDEEKRYSKSLADILG